QPCGNHVTRRPSGSRHNGAWRTMGHLGYAAQCARHAVSLLRGRLPGSHLQTDAGRQGPGLVGPCEPPAEAVWLDCGDRLPVGEHAVRRRAAQLASAKADAKTDASHVDRKVSERTLAAERPESSGDYF